MKEIMKERLRKIFFLNVSRESDIWRLRPSGIRVMQTWSQSTQSVTMCPLETKALPVVRSVHTHGIDLLLQMHSQLMRGWQTAR